jgi:CelD/BcsL family acetyltransferase involved in cellulose biosynthesis
LSIEIVPYFSDAERWDRYVADHSQSRFCHLFAYRCIERSYGYRPCYFAFRERGSIVGVLPAFETTSLFFGKRLVSQPFSEYGGMLLDADLSEAAFAEIIAGVRSFLSTRRIPALEMHGRQGILSETLGDPLIESNQQQYAYLPLDRSIEEIWKNVLTYQVRKAVQKAERSGITVVQKCDPGTLRETFFPLYVDSMMRLGVPPHGIRYYLDCYAAFTDRMQIFWAIRNGVHIAGLLGFTCGGRVSIINIVSDERYWEERPNDLIHWEYIKWAKEAGFSCFDFGSVRYEGQLRYKQKWGCRIEPHAYYVLPREPHAKAAGFNSSSPAMKKMSDLWSHHVPKAVGKAIGPFMRKHLVR